MSAGGGQRVDNPPHSVDKSVAPYRPPMAPRGTLPPYAESRDLTVSVGSAQGPQETAQGAEPSGYLERLERLNATSEAELVRGHGGECRRCGGTGAIPSGWLDDGRYRDCPRCRGTGSAP